MIVLRIRKEQREALRAAEVESFVARAVAFLAETIGPGDDAARRDLVRHAIARGARHDVRGERQVALLAAVMSVFGRDVDEAPWARAILEDRRLHVVRRVDRLLDEAISREALR